MTRGARAGLRARLCSPLSSPVSGGRALSAPPSVLSSTVSPEPRPGWTWSVHERCSVSLTVPPAVPQSPGQAGLSSLPPAPHFVSFPCSHPCSPNPFSSCASSCPHCHHRLSLPEAPVSCQPLPWLPEEPFQNASLILAVVPGTRAGPCVTRLSASGPRPPSRVAGVALLCTCVIQACDLRPLPWRGNCVAGSAGWGPGRGGGVFLELPSSNSLSALPARG